MTTLLLIALAASLLVAVRQWDRARHAERVMMEMAANARAVSETMTADDNEWCEWQKERRRLDNAATAAAGE
jgi:hypothetical protein